MHANGYVQLPPGKLANSVIWLEVLGPKPRGVAPPESGGSAGSPAASPALVRLGAADAALFRQLYRDIGRDWLWAGLTGKSEQEIAARLARPDILSFAAMAAGAPIGMLDIETTDAGAEIVYFGFTPAFVGKGWGAWLMDQAKRTAAEAGISRLWLHTCNFDHPRAVDFYRRQGFRIYAVGYEIMDDPRLVGLLPRDAAPHVPLIDG